MKKKSEQEKTLKKSLIRSVGSSSLSRLRCLSGSLSLSLLSLIPAQTERFFAQTERRQLDEFSSHLTLEVFW